MPTLCIVDYSDSSAINQRKRTSIINRSRAITQTDYVQDSGPGFSAKQDAVSGVRMLSLNLQTAAIDIPTHGDVLVGFQWWVQSKAARHHGRGQAIVHHGCFIKIAITDRGIASSHIQNIRPRAVVEAGAERVAHHPEAGACRWIASSFHTGDQGCCAEVHLRPYPVLRLHM